jgi:DNA invertase Pin-like site-specific DNA recombinase
MLIRKETNMAKVLYARVSSISQNLDRQVQEADTYNKVFQDKCSGKDTLRPALAQMIEFVREGDSVYAHELSRLARNTFDLIDLVRKLLSKGVSVHFIKENLHFSPNKEDATSTLMLTILGSIGQFERDLIRTRQLEGIAIRKAAKGYPGKSKRLTPEQVKELKELAKNKEAWPTKELSKRYNICRASVYNYLKV